MSTSPIGRVVCNRGRLYIADFLRAGHGGLQFATAGDEGRDVFFTTRDQLLPRRHGRPGRSHDAREPHEPGEQVAFPEATSMACGGEECKPQISQPPAFPESASSTLTGLGNVAPVAPPPAPPPPVKCAKGKELSHGKCVKAKKKAKAKAKKKAGKKTKRKGARGAGRGRRR